MAFYPSDSGSAEPELIGTYSGDVSIDVSNYIRGNDTVNNFIVEVYRVYLGVSVFSDEDGRLALSETRSCYPSKSLSGNTLRITSTSVTYSYSYASGYQRISSSASIYYRVWHV